MRHVKLLVVGALIAVAAAIPATAVAKSPGLELTEGESKTPAASPVFVAVDIAGCFPSEPEGKIEDNGKSKVKIHYTHTEVENHECGSEGSTIGGDLQELELSTKGTLSGKGNVVIKETVGAQTCAYEYKKFSVPLPLPGPVNLALVTVTGKLVKTGSAKTCPKSVTREANYELISYKTLEPLQAELT